MSTASAPRRVALGLLSLLVLGAAIGVAATWSVGSHIWPPHETTPAPKIGTTPAELEARIAQGDAKAPLTIGVIGDIQAGLSEFADLLDSMHAEHVDFILQLGDAANFGLPGRYAVLRHLYETHAPGIPVIAVPGNHDIEPFGLSPWNEWAGPIPWRVDLRGWRILGLDDADGTLSPESMKLLQDSAKEAPPKGGTILVAHRPLAAPPNAEGTDSVARRSKQVASTGLVATMTFQGHWHANDEYRDAAGTVHHLLGENCDRSSTGDDPDVSRAVLVLQAGAPGHELRLSRIPRHVRLREEFLRTAVASFYPQLRRWPLATWIGIAALLAVSFLAARAALRRPSPSAAV